MLGGREKILRIRRDDEVEENSEIIKEWLEGDGERKIEIMVKRN